MISQSEHDITGLYHGSLNQSNVKGLASLTPPSMHGGARDFTVCL